MHLRRLEVEGGFLNGLDLTFADGLNVLIGARGSGKTSVIEVLRYCLDVDAVTDEARKRARDHALWVLADGCATLTIEIDGIERVIRRGVNQDSEVTVPTDRVLFVSQKEIEGIGLDGLGRRRMLDAFVEADAQQPIDDSARLATDVEGLGHEVYGQRAELDDVIEQLGQLAEVPEQLKQAEAEQEATKTEGTELATLQAKANELSDAIGELSEVSDAYAAASASTLTWRQDVGAARRGEPEYGRLPKEAAAEVNDATTRIRRDLDQALTHLDELGDSLTAKTRAGLPVMAGRCLKNERLCKPRTDGPPSPARPSSPRQRSPRITKGERSTGAT